MILGMPARRITPSVTYSGWRLPSSQIPTSVTLSNGNRDAEFAATGAPIVTSIRTRDRTLGGKFAIRIATATTSGGNAKPPVVGIVLVDSGAPETNYNTGGYLGGFGNQWACWVNESGSNELTYSAGSSKNIGNLTPAREWPLYSEIMIELDLDNREVWIGADGNWQSGADPATRTLPTYTLPSVTSATKYMLVVERYYASGGRCRLLIPSEFTVPATAGYTPGWPD